MRLPFDVTIDDINELPYTISYVIRKRSQIDSFRELPKEKRPTERMIWEGTSKEIEEFFDRVFDRKKRKTLSEYNEGIIFDFDKKYLEE